MKKAIASAGLLALGAAGVYSARADWTAGPDKPWTISGTLRGFYDDNYDTQPNGTNKLSSYGYELAPSVSLNISSGPTLFTASYAYSMKYYEDRPGNKIDQTHDAELFLNHNFNDRYSGDLTESFVDSQEPEILGANGGAPLRANGDNYHNDAAINFHAQITKLLGFVVGYANNWYDYTGQLPNQVAGDPTYGTALNRFEHLVTLDSRWTIQPETVGVFGYQFNDVDYLSEASLAPVGQPFTSPSTRDSYSHSVYVGVEHTFRSDLTFSGRAGVQVVDYYQASPGSNPNSLGPYADLNLSYNYIDTGSLSLGFHQSKTQTVVAFDPTTGTFTADQETSTVYGSVTQTLTPLSPKLQATLTMMYQNLVYNGGGYNNQSDTYFSLGLNFAYQFTHYFSAEFGYDYDLYSSVVPGLGYDRNRVYIGVTATY